MDIPENVAKLSGDLIQTWKGISDRATVEGFGESQATAIAWTVVNRMQAAGTSDTPVVYWGYPLASPGTYMAQVGGEFEETPQNISGLQRAIDILYNKGQPVALIEGHGSGVEFGSIPAARMDGDVLRGALVYDSWYDQGIRSGTYGFSIEGQFNYTDPAYTDAEVFSIWPTAWALCPAGVMVAVPPGEPLEVAASQCGGECNHCGSGCKRSVRLYAKAPEGATEPTLKGADMDELKDLQKRMDALEVSAEAKDKELTDLHAAHDKLVKDHETVTKERDDLTAEKAKQAEAVIAAEVEKDTEAVLARAPEANREGMKADLEAAADNSKRKDLLAAWGKVLPAAPEGPSKEKLLAGDGAAPTDRLAAAAADEKAAYKLMAEHPKEYPDYRTAIRQVDRMKG